MSSWGDQAAAANHIRTAVERLLDARRIPKTHPKSKKRMVLHDRIERIKDSQPNAYAALMAIKWLGNAGSHTDDLSRDDLFDAFDILELALHELYVGHAKRIGRLIASINTRKGPTKAKRQGTARLVRLAPPLPSLWAARRHLPIFCFHWAPADCSLRDGKLPRR